MFTKRIKMPNALFWNLEDSRRSWIKGEAEPPQKGGAALSSRAAALACHPIMLKFMDCPPQPLRFNK